MTDTVGFAKYTGSVPTSGISAGTKFYNQAYILDPKTTRPLKLTVTNGGIGTIGS